MRAVIQRVIKASVEIEEKVEGEIAVGLLVLVGIEDADTEEDAEWLARKIGTIRIFDDGEGVMNLSVNEAGGKVLVISQFTLHAKTKKGTRPSYIHAAKPHLAIPMYEKFKLLLSANVDKGIESGVFGADMKVSLVNDGPVTIIIDTKNKA
ncbi:D-tyrosyl-tRNA(Tyr) deacylase [Cryomorpha ignava]|uniref:D-aminoacyl-tRNA deacylase n=1 Tax=Cryomorpha ignava TaxID=101383 RepID=A0A7K3WMZ5_9FLAO|nr:D-aminoacyl-tRNA deacylase [Cryomorpha ignava]NEN23020.1 D-tyrosyl-tRNA(Tyr) deacylase [Cryomorpha ignava]